MRLRTRHSGPLRGVLRLPGDKSISHRAALLAAPAEGRSRIDGMLQAGVTRVMVESLDRLGVAFVWERGTLVVDGVGRAGFRVDGATGGPPELNCGNSATTFRLIAGVLAGRTTWDDRGKARIFILDSSSQLRKRPMNRIIEPLREMGAEIESLANPGHPPLKIRQAGLHGIEYKMPVASAQVKSAVLLAGLSASGSTLVEEPSPSRDHTERFLRWLGVRLELGDRTARVFPIDRPLDGFRMTVPGDFSSAAFPIAAATIVPGSEITIEGVGLNPRRTGFLAVLRRMGADIEALRRDDSGAEPVGDLRVRAAPLSGTVVEGAEVVDMIDEFPALAAAAAFADGTTVVRNAAELRHKESDRISVLAAELRKLGVAVDESADGFAVRGPAALRPAAADSHGDHRLAMALAVAGMAAQEGVQIEGAECIAESFPDFAEVFLKLGADLQ
jgi:3-phosphoshikimate 1-carboxyvinyltransferase